MFRFEKLDVWKKAVEYADLIYRLTQNFPSEERFGLTSQLRRSAVSISSNIAEGTSRSSDTDLARFVEIAKRQRFLTDAMFSEAYKYAEELAKMLSGLRRTLKRARS